MLPVGFQKKKWGGRGLSYLTGFFQLSQNVLLLFIPCSPRKMKIVGFYLGVQSQSPLDPLL